MRTGFAPALAAAVERARSAGLQTIVCTNTKAEAVQVAREGERRDFDEYWYSADVRWYVRWVGRRGDVAFEERLRAYQPGRR